MGLRFPEQMFGSCFFVTTSFRERKRLGEVHGVYEALADSLRFYLAKYNARLPAFVFMPSHIHLLLVITGEQLGNFMRDFKKYTSQHSLKELVIYSERIWQHCYDRVVVYSEDTFRQKLSYIHHNPVKAGLVNVPVKWYWSSAITYESGNEGPIPVWQEWQL